MNTHTEYLQGLTIHAQHRLMDLKDWLTRHDLPDSAYIKVTLDRHSKPTNCVEVWIPCESYKEAEKWGYLHTKCASWSHGWDCRDLTPFNAGCEHAFILIQMPDFRITLSFPMKDHPKCNLMPV